MHLCRAPVMLALPCLALLLQGCSSSCHGKKGKEYDACIEGGGRSRRRSREEPLIQEHTADEGAAEADSSDGEAHASFFARARGKHGVKAAGGSGKSLKPELGLRRSRRLTEQVENWKPQPLVWKAAGLLQTTTVVHAKARATSLLQFVTREVDMVDSSQNALILVIICSIIVVLLCVHCLVFIPYSYYQQQRAEQASQRKPAPPGQGGVPAADELATALLAADYTSPPRAMMGQDITYEDDDESDYQSSGPSPLQDSGHLGMVQHAPGNIGSSLIDPASLPASAKSLPQSQRNLGGYTPLYDGLIVPEDAECALIVPAVAGGTWGTGHTCSFTVTDTNGAPIVGFSITTPAGEAGQTTPRIVMTSLSGNQMLAYCCTRPGQADGPFFICRPAGDLFATLEREAGSRDDQYYRLVLHEQSSSNKLIFQVPKTRGHFAVQDERGILLAEVAPWVPGAPSDAEEPAGRLLVRIGPKGDAGALICGLLCALQLVQLQTPFAPQDLAKRLVASSGMVAITTGSADGDLGSQDSLIQSSRRSGGPMRR